jgi:hypothetical protein
MLICGGKTWLLAKPAGGHLPAPFADENPE